MTTIAKTLHIVAGYSAGHSLKTMLVKQNLALHHEVLVFGGDLSIGPLFTSVSDAALKPRVDYFKTLYQGEPSSDNKNYRHNITQHIRDFHDFPFDDYATLIVWHSRTAAERLLLEWVCDLCKDYQGKLEAVDVKDDAFAYLDYQILGLGDLTWQKLSVCLTRYRQPLPSGAVKRWAKKWNNHCNNPHSLLRICGGWGAVTVPETLFDDLIVSRCLMTFLLAFRVISNVRSYLHYPISDFFIAYRLRVLIAQGQLTADNSDRLVNTKNFSVKLAAELKKEKVLHITHDTRAENLSKALTTKGLADNHHILGLQDDFSVGQLPTDLSMPSLKKRGDWWQAQDGGDSNEYISSMQDFFNTPFSDYDKIVIWHGETVQDQLRLYLMHHLYDGDLHEIQVTGKMYDGAALTLGVLSPIEVVQLLTTVEAIDKSRATFYRQQWRHWSQSSSVLRIMMDVNITAVNEDHFDTLMLSKCTKEWQAAAYIVGHSMGTCGQYLSDGFFTRRLQHLVNTGKVHSKGNIKALREFQVKLP